MNIILQDMIESTDQQILLESDSVTIVRVEKLF